MKKFLSILMAVTMMATVLAGCGAKEEEKPAASAPAASAPAASAPAAAAETDTNTVAIGAVVLARDDISEDEIYTFVSTIFENTEAITGQHAKGAELSLEYAASMTSVPYHPGAAKYFKEKGIEVAAVKEGAGTGAARGNLTFGTGGESGTYYAFGGVLGSYVSNNTNVNITTVSSGGSAVNIEDNTVTTAIADNAPNVTSVATLALDPEASYIVSFNGVDESHAEGADVALFGIWFVKDAQTVGIKDINANENISNMFNAEVYTINGVKVRNAGQGLTGLKKGVYLINGKKTVVK